MKARVTFGMQIVSAGCSEIPNIWTNVDVALNYMCAIAIDELFSDD